LRLFPDDVRWRRAIMTAEELAEVLYIDYSYWNELTGGTRRPADGAERVRSGVEVYGMGFEYFWRAAEAVKAGVAFPPMIVVTHDGQRWVVVEGHVRLTSFHLAGALPDEIEVIAGRSPRTAGWPLY
jgi:hypothetical protein